MDPAPRSALRAPLAATLVVSFGLSAGAAQSASRRVHYWVGPHRVEARLALDEVWVAVGKQRIGRLQRVAAARDGAELAARAAGIAEVREGRGRAGAVLYRGSASSRNDRSRAFLTTRLAVRFVTSAKVDALMEQRGLSVVRPVGPDARTFILAIDDDAPLRSLDVANALQEGGHATWAMPLLLRTRRLKHTPDDPLFGRQWHLLNDGTQVAGAVAGEDANIATAWDAVRGLGVNIGIVDDGMQTTHHDLAANVRFDLSCDYYDDDADPSPDVERDRHGTSVGGIAAARGDNATGVTGAAPHGSLVGIRLIAGPISDEDEAAALGHRRDDALADAVHVSNSSWGPYDTGGVVEGPGVLAADALAQGTALGRGGRGIVYVFAAGNGYDDGDDSNYDGYANARYTIAVAATGADGTATYYSEPGANLLVNAPSSDAGYGTTTTDLLAGNGYDGGDYTDSFGGTSSAAPLVAGIVALMLEANPQLTWRDVQHVLLMTATKNHPLSTGWKDNGAGLSFHHRYGFGRVDASAAVASASGWPGLPAEAVPLTYTGGPAAPVAIPDAGAGDAQDSYTVASPAGFVAEHVEFSVSVTHPRRGHLMYELTSPGGMTAVVGSRPDDNANLSWTFTSPAFWGESPDGPWTLTVADMVSGYTGTLDAWSLSIYGHVTGGSSPSAPTVGAIGDQAIAQDASPSAPIPFTVADVDTPLDALAMSAASDNATLIPDPSTDIAFAGTGAQRTLTVTPAAGQSGSALITVRAYDGIGTGSSQFTLTVDPGPPTVFFAAASSAGLESVASPTIEVQLSSWPGSDVTVDYVVRGGTATGGGVDYTLADGTVTFTAGSTSEDISLAVEDDSVDESDETVQVFLAAPTNAAVATAWEHEYTILDDDDTPAVSFASAASSAPESYASVVIWVSLSAPSGLPVSADYGIVGGTASGGGVDYVLPAGTIIFPPGVTQRALGVRLVDDPDEEDDETVRVALSGAANASIGSPDAHTLTITSRDIDESRFPFGGNESILCGASAEAAPPAPTWLAMVLVVLALRGARRRRRARPLRAV